MKPRWQFKKRADTAIGAFCMGQFAYRRGDTVVPTRLNRKDARAWAMGWNDEAKTKGDPRRQFVPEIQKRTPRKMKTPPHDTEAAVLREAMQIARARGWYVERRNTGAIRTEDSFFRYGSPGAADLIVVVRLKGFLPIHIEAEAKRRDGRGRQSEGQKAFEESMKEYGIPYFIFTNGEEFLREILKICLDFKRRTC